jgi:hypothetical protein
MKKSILILLPLLFAGLTPEIVGRPVSTLSVRSLLNQATTLSEEQKVAHLINYIRTLNGAIFIRNGKEFKPTEAADHLRSKWEKHKKRVKTAHGFVDRLATVSKTNEPYQIRFGDGRTVRCCDLLNEELRRIEQ